MHGWLGGHRPRNRRDQHMTSLSLERAPLEKTQKSPERNVYWGLTVMVGTRTRETLRKRVAIFCVRTSDTLLQFIPLPF